MREEQKKIEDEQAISDEELSEVSGGIQASRLPARSGQQTAASDLVYRPGQGGGKVRRL